ncbi:hypothetical protein GCM10011579_063840 [Streptomyces albiflavescens]|uniref:Uncharacterized protein n=1 Tax=Streptomyces albiflavescens TaxID=1623582 RepID=A0A917YB81_9ACTN|nr:hypothetical protein GCM10011579_063840 [Streptomyces albiflavescens]
MLFQQFVAQRHGAGPITVVTEELHDHRPLPNVRQHLNWLLETMTARSERSRVPSDGVAITQARSQPVRHEATVPAAALNEWL